MLPADPRFLSVQSVTPCAPPNRRSESSGVSPVTRRPASHGPVLEARVLGRVTAPAAVTCSGMLWQSRRSIAPCGCLW